mgnify:CR=1 FL=1
MQAFTFEIVLPIRTQLSIPGIFQGELYKVIETRTSTNSNGLLLLGDFSRFDGNMVRNAIMIEVDYE